jgi:hypothetical protein
MGWGVQLETMPLDTSCRLFQKTIMDALVSSFLYIRIYKNEDILNIRANIYDFSRDGNNFRENPNHRERKGSTV